MTKITIDTENKQQMLAYDLIANTLGAIVGFLVMHFYGLHKLRRSMVPLYVRHHRHSSHHRSSK